MKQKILITGGNGYLAASFKKTLGERYDITCVTRADFDLSDPIHTYEWFKTRHFDTVIHTAIVGGSRLNKEDHMVMQQNLLMYYNLLFHKKRFEKLITFGSGAELFGLHTPYGVSKKIISESIRSTDNFYNLRIFGVFDENELNTRFIKTNILRYIDHQPMIIHANKLMDFFYMKDLISLVEYYLTDSNPPKETNCSYAQKHTLTNIASMINELSHYKVPIVVENADKFDVYCGDALNIPLHMIGLQQGIIETYAALTSSIEK